MDVLMVTFPSSPNYRTILLALSIVFIETAVDTFPPLLLVAAIAEEGVVSRRQNPRKRELVED